MDWGYKGGENFVIFAVSLTVYEISSLLGLEIVNLKS